MTSFDLTRFGKDLLTRDQGTHARVALREAVRKLAPGERIVVDLDRGGAVTPSFVDECLGRLVLEIGESRFRRSIQLRATEESTRRLVNRVLGHRASEARTKRTAG